MVHPFLNKDTKQVELLNEETENHWSVKELRDILHETAKQCNTEALHLRDTCDHYRLYLLALPLNTLVVLPAAGLLSFKEINHFRAQADYYF